MSEALDQMTSEATAILTPLGFNLVQPRHWVRQADKAVRQHFALQAMKGGLYSVVWGFDLVFCPILQSGRLVSKGGAKTAMDITYDPIDESGRVEPWHAFEPGAPKSKISAVVADCLRRALPIYGEVQSVERLVEQFEIRSRKKFARFSLENYIQTDIAWGLALIATGCPAEGERHIARFCERFQVQADSAALRKAVSAATALSGVDA